LSRLFLPPHSLLLLFLRIHSLLPLVKKKEKNRFTSVIILRYKDFSDEDLTSALLSIEASARVGVPIKHTLSFVEKAMEKGIKGKGIETATRAMTYGVGKEIDFEQLGKFAHEKLDEGLIDDKLSIEIYKEVSGRHEERLKVKEALKQEKEKGKKK